MKWCWLIQPDVEIDHNRVYDQLFIGGTYLNKQCLIIAASLDHVVAWLWCDKESTTNYIKLISQLQPPLIISLDGGTGALSAIKNAGPPAEFNAAPSTFNAISDAKPPLGRAQKPARPSTA